MMNVRFMSTKQDCDMNFYFHIARSLCWHKWGWAERNWTIPVLRTCVNQRRADRPSICSHAVVSTHEKRKVRVIIYQQQSFPVRSRSDVLLDYLQAVVSPNGKNNQMTGTFCLRSLNSATSSMRSYHLTVKNGPIAITYRSVKILQLTYGSGDFHSCSLPPL